MKRLIPLLLAVALLLALVAVVAAGADPAEPLTPTDCPVGQYLCLTPGHGGYILCQDGILDIQPDPENPELSIVYCEYVVRAPVLPVVEQP